MDADLLGLVELILVFGLVLGLGAWQLWSVRRAERDAEEKRRRANRPESSKPMGADDGTGG